MYSMNLSVDQEQKLRHLMTIFLEENKKLNLSAYRTEEQCWVGNVLDSVSGVRSEDLANVTKVIDVGTGGGFPLLPLAILFPNVQFTGFDATKKKMDAVQRMLDRLQVAGFKLQVELLVGRAEELGHNPELREQFDVVLGRGLAALPTLLEYMSPFTRPPASGGAKVGGTLICWKSLDIEQELLDSLRAREKLRCRLIDRYRYTLPGDWGKRQLLVFEKISTLPREFPREIGMPKKEPL